MKKTYVIHAKIWLYPGNAAWHFVTIPQDTTLDIDEYFAHVKRGWGSLPVIVTINKTTWKTSIFPDRKTKTCLLPIKGEVRKKEDVHEGSSAKINIQINA